MTPTELIAAFGPVAGVFAFLWINRTQSKGEKPADPSIKLDAIVMAQTEILKQLAVLLDRGHK